MRNFCISILFVCSIAFPSLAQERVTNLPAIYLTTNSGVDPSTKTYLSGRIVVKSPDPTEELDMIMEVRCRGNSIMGTPKKSYRVKLDKKTRLLNNKANAKSWVLLANDFENSLIRNGIANKISELIEMDFTPSVRFVDVFMNGKYMGNYMLTDQVEVRENRVPVEEQPLNAITAPIITGGYLIELDGYGPGETSWFYSNQGVPVTIKYPDDDEINTTQYNYIRDYTRNFEDILFSSDFKDPEKGYRPWVDMHSLVNWYIGSELTGNPDAFWSTFVYKYRSEDVFYFGPLWDFDKGFNNDSRLGDATLKLMRIHAHIYRNWIERFWRDDYFKEAVKVRWEELMEREIINDILDYIDEAVDEISESQKLNATQWNKGYNWENEIRAIKTYVRARVAFLTESFSTYEPDVDPEPFDPEGGLFIIQNPNSQLVMDFYSYNATENQLSLVTEKKETNTYYDAQLWKFIPVDNTYYQIISSRSGKAVTGNGMGNRLLQTTPDAKDNKQLWRIIMTDKNNVFGLANKASGYVIDNSGTGTANHTPVIEWANEIPRNVNQIWLLRNTTPKDTGIARFSPSFVKVYPNPVSDYLYVNLNSQSLFSKHVHVSICRLNGQQVINTSTEINDNRLSLPIIDYKLSSGMYLLKIHSGEEIYRAKFVVR